MNNYYELGLRAYQSQLRANLHQAPQIQYTNDYYAGVEHANMFPGAVPTSYGAMTEDTTPLEPTKEKGDDPGDDDDDDSEHPSVDVTPLGKYGPQKMLFTNSSGVDRLIGSHGHRGATPAREVSVKRHTNNADFGLPDPAVAQDGEAPDAVADEGLSDNVGDY